MPELKLNQLQYESDTWKRLLVFMMEENIYLKNRLSEILKNSFNNKLLDELENYNSRFIKEDELIRLLRNEVAELEKLLKREVSEDGKCEKEIRTKLKTIRNNIQIAERQFTNVKLQFNNYLSENI